MENPPLNPLAPDAPIVALIRDMKPLLATATEAELLAIVQRCKAMVQQPVTLQAELRKEAAPRTGKAAKLKSILDSI